MVGCGVVATSAGIRGALTVWLVYVVIDLTFVLIAGITFSVGILFSVSFATKLAAAYWGAATRLRNCVKVDKEAEMPITSVLKP